MKSWETVKYVHGGPKGFRQHRRNITFDGRRKTQWLTTANDGRMRTRVCLSVYLCVRACVSVFVVCMCVHL